MFACQAWAGSVLPTKKLSGKHFRVFCRLGGAYLGCVFDLVGSVPTERARSLQQQASKLLRHPTRTPRYLQLYVGSTMITPKEFVYKACLTKCQGEVVAQHLDLVDSLEVLWDEDDVKACQDAKNKHACRVYGDGLSVFFKRRLDMRVMALNANRDYSMLCLNATKRVIFEPLSLLEGFTNITNLCLVNTIPCDWTVLNQLTRLEHLSVERTQHSVHSDSRHLQINDAYDQMFSVLAKLPCLATLGFTNTRDVSSKLKLVPNIRHLCVCSSHFDFGCLPSTLCSLDASLVTCKPTTNGTTNCRLPTKVFQPRLVSLSIQRTTHMIGTIPCEVGQATNLAILCLPWNHLEGSIPTEVGFLKVLANLNLSNNTLVGNIPSELGLASSLTLLDLSHNQLSGLVPCELGALTNLTHLHLSHNQLSGQLPSHLGRLHKLRLFYAFPNNLLQYLPNPLSWMTKYNLILDEVLDKLCDDDLTAYNDSQAW